MMTSRIRIGNPKGLARPLGMYSHVARVKANEFLFIAGQVAVNTRGKLVGADDFEAQAGQVFSNLGVALRSAGAGYRNIVEFTTYLVNARDIPKFMRFRKRQFGKLFPGGKYPPNTLLIVDRLVREELLLEISAIAAL